LIETDVLVIGGGVMGLWLLNDLRDRQYRAVLLEHRELGGDQTSHSPVYIHQGHMYNRRIELARRLKALWPSWQSWLEEHGAEANVPSHFGFVSPGDAEERERFWDEVGLSYRRVPIPPALEGGLVKVACETPEVCLSPRWLVAELSRKVMDSTCLVREISHIDLDDTRTRVLRVEAIAAEGERLVVQPKALVLAAGASNQGLLELTAGGRRSLTGRMQHSQQVRGTHILVVKGEKTHLEPLTGVFPIHRGSLQIYTRDLGEQTVWLVADHRTKLIAFVEDWIEYGSSWWLPDVVGLVSKFVPRCFAERERLRWGVYEAPKVEGSAGGEIPSEERVEQFGFRNLWVVWPTKLTLAPLASLAVLNELESVVSSPSTSGGLPLDWGGLRVEPPITSERWERTPLLPWEEFSRSYLRRR